MEPLQNMIKSVWARIQAHDFYSGCSKPDCTWCNFTRRYQNIDTLGDDFETLMDDF
jgi:DNA helicase-2/ATP-dependent DNA helicase PcrA